MQWIVLFTGIAILLLLAVPKKKLLPYSPVLEDESLHDTLLSAAQRAAANGLIKSRFPRRYSRAFRRNLSILRRISDEELQPASQRLWQHSRFLQQEAKQVIRLCRALPRLPRAENGMARAALFADILVRHSTASIDEASVASALQIWQSHSPMTTDELNALPVFLQASLLRELCHLAHSCVTVHKARQAAIAVHHLHQKQKNEAAHQKARPFENDPAFLEALFQLDQSIEWLTDQKSLLQEAYRQQALLTLRTQNAITALQNLRQIHWSILLEEASQTHELLHQDPVYPQMDAQSRAYYRACAAHIARRYRKTERAVCAAALSLSKRSSARKVETHVGYYLLDEGYRRLLEQLDVYHRKTRFLLWFIEKKKGFSQIGLLFIFVLLIGFGYMKGYAIAMLVPFAIVFCQVFGRFFHFLLNQNSQQHMIPRIELDHLTPDLQTLVICPCVLSDAASTHEAVRHLTMQHEGAKDTHLHFMLLGDFEDSLTASAMTDGEIIAAASSAIQTAVESNGHPFFYFQRERSSAPGERTWHGRERRRGAIKSILHLIQGKAVQDRFAFASCDPAALGGQYRYILFLDENSILTMDAALKLIGTLIHPLQKRQEFKGRMRGITIVQPQFKPAPQLNRTCFSRWSSRSLTPFHNQNHYFQGEGLIDPEAFLAQTILPEGRLWDSSLTEGLLAGCRTACDVFFWKGQPHTLKEALRKLYSYTRSSWQQLMLLNPFSGSGVHRNMGPAIAKQTFASLNGILRLILMLYAALTGRDALLIASFLIPELVVLLPFSFAALRSALLRLSLLPSIVCTQCDAIGRALFRMLLRRQHLLEGNLQAKSLSSLLQPSMLYFTLNLSMAGLFAAIPVLFKQSWSGLLPAAFWAAFPFWLPYAETERPLQKREKVSRRMRSGKPKQTSKPISRIATPLSLPPDAHLLTGGGTTMMIDAQGGGLIMRNGIALTHFDEHCSVPSGIRIYLRDTQDGAFWMATDPWLTTSVRFETAQAVFCAERTGISSELRIWLHPLGGSCIHQLQIENRSDAERILELCTYLEPASDCNPEAHPIEKLEGYGVSNGTIAQRLVTDTPIDAFAIQTDRSRFLGRSGSVFAPQALAHAIPAMQEVLAEAANPCISLRAQFHMPAKTSAVFCLITHPICEKNAQLSEHQLPEIQASYNSALTFTLATARCLKLTDNMQQAASRMTGFMAYDRRSGVSKPMLLYLCRDTLNEPLLKVLLGAYSFWQFCSFPAELVVLIEDSPVSPLLFSNAEALISSCSSDSVRLLSKITQDEKQQLLRAARLVLSAEAGTLEQQLDRQILSLRVRPRYRSRPPIRWKHQLPAIDEMIFSNEIGGFSAETGNYTWTLSPGRMTPAQWSNQLCGSQLYTLAGDSSLLPTRYTHSVLVQQEQFFIRDEENRLLWSPTRLPLGQYTTIRTTYAPGETTYESSGYGIYIRIQCFSDVQEVLGIRIIHLQNISQDERSLTFFHMCRFNASTPLTTVPDGGYVAGEFSDGFSGLCALEPATDLIHTMPHDVFQGVWGRMPFALSSLDTPPALEGDTAVLSYTFHLKPGESRKLHTAIGFSADRETLHRLFDHVRTDGASMHLRIAQQYWENQLSMLQFDLPDHALNLMLGHWLPYQVAVFCQYHQTSIEILDHIMLRRLLNSLPALLLTQPDTVRNLLLQCAAHPALHHSVSCMLALIDDVAAYADTSGDTGILHEKTTLTDEQPLLAHCIMLLDQLPSGAHGLPLDERDGSESVSLGMQLCETLRRIAPYCKDGQPRLLDRRTSLMAAIERYAWDGGWYLSGWKNDGSAMGSSRDPKGSIALLPQALAVLCGFSRERCDTAMENAWHFLCNQETHHAKEFCQFAAALHQLGQEERAWELVQSRLPFAQLSKTADEWHGDHAAWLMAVVLEQLLGLRRRGNELMFKPVVPEHWDALRITWRFGSSTYHLRASRDCLQASADGQNLANGILLLVDDGRIHEALFPLRS